MSFYVVVSDRLGGRFAVSARTEREASFVMQVHINKKAQCVEIYRTPFHSTTDEKALLKFYGKDTYWDNVSKKKPSLNQKRVE